MLMLTMIITMLSQAGASAERIFEVLDAQSEVVERPNAGELPDIEGEIVFENVSFRYFEHGEWVLDEVSFRAIPGPVGFSAMFALVFAFVPTILKRNYHISIPWLLELLIFLALFLHAAGGVLGLYYRIDAWDTITHFVSTFMLGVVALTILYLMHVYWDGLYMDIRAIMVFTLFIGTFLGITWEVLEWSSDQMFGTLEQHGLDDTMKDLVMDMVGAMIAAMLGARWIVDGTLRRMTADLGDALNRRVFAKAGSPLFDTVRNDVDLVI